MTCNSKNGIASGCCVGNYIVFIICTISIAWLIILTYISLCITFATYVGEGSEDDNIRCEREFEGVVVEKEHGIVHIALYDEVNKVITLSEPDFNVTIGMNVVVYKDCRYNCLSPEEKYDHDDEVDEYHWNPPKVKKDCGIAIFLVVFSLTFVFMVVCIMVIVGTIVIIVIGGACTGACSGGLCYLMDDL